MGIKQEKLVGQKRETSVATECVQRSHSRGCIITKKILHATLILLLFFLIKPAGGHAQTQIPLDVPRIVPISPTATSMQKYQTYPVDHSTGIPNITIPLYEIVAGEVTIPVTLSYHASGLKPKEDSGFAGTGWTLNIEPSISRQILGTDDFSTFYGWYYNPLGGYNPQTEDDVVRFYEELADGIRDNQPDKFIYKLPNGGGAGYFIDRVFLTLPRNNDIVKYTGNGFSITDPGGVQYLFYGTYEKAESPNLGWLNSTYITRWLCSSIQSARNPEQTLVRFSYHKDPIRFSSDNYQSGMTDKIQINTRRNMSGSWENILTRQTSYPSHYYIYPSSWSSGTNDLALVPTPDPNPVSYSGDGSLTSKIVTTRYLTEATFMGNRLTVSHKSVGIVPNNTEVLDEILVTDKNENLVRKIKFHITPYNPRTSLTKLDSVVISAPGVESRTYAFAYQNAFSVPSIYTKAIDHWGFCNGPNDNTSNSSVIGFKRRMSFPNPSGFDAFEGILNLAGASREPDHEWTKTGIITQITDPQGISTRFSYEGNFGAFRDNSRPYYENKDYLHPVGGLRIKSIEAVDPQTRAKFIKEYRYGLTKPEINNFQPVWGGGAIKHIVTERDYRSGGIRRLVGDRETDNPYITDLPFIVTDIWTESVTTYNSMPVSKITINGGSPVLYNIVSETTRSSKDNASLQTIYYYNVKAHEFEDVLVWDDANPQESVKTFLMNQSEEVLGRIARKLPVHPQEPSDDYVNSHISTNQLYGKLVRKESYRNGQLVLSQKNTYKKIPAWYRTTEIDIPYKRISGNTQGLSSTEVFLWNNYYQNSGDPQTTYYLDCEYYAALDKETTTTYYDVDGRWDALTTEKKYDYQFDYLTPGGSLSPRRIESTNSDNTTMTDSLDYLPNYPGILARHKHIEGSSWKESRILFASGSCLPQKVQSRTDKTPIFRDEIIYNKYDSYGNPTEIMGKDNTPITILWGYGGQFPVAKIENASYSQVSGESDVFESWSAYPEPPAAMWAKISSLKETFPEARISTYEYHPLKGVVSITGPEGVTTKFEYDNYNRLTGSYLLNPANLQKVMLQKYIYNFGK